MRTASECLRDSARDGEAQRLSRRQWIALGSSGLALICAVLYANGVIGGKFLWDDEQFVTRNLFLLSWKNLPALLFSSITQGAGLTSNLYRPIQALTHLIDVQLWGFNPVAHRITNLVLHIAATISIFLMVLKFLSLKSKKPSILAAFLAVSLYACHPLQSFAVSYISGRGDILVLLFGSLSVLAYESYFVLSLILAALAMFSKESGMMIPLLLAGYEWVRSRSTSQPLRMKRLVTAASLSVAYVVSRLTWLNFADTLNFYRTDNVLVNHPSYRIFTYFSTFAKGMQLLVWPVGLHHERSWLVYSRLFYFPVIAGALLLALVAGLVWRLRNRAPLTAVGLVWLVGATLPTSNLIALINALIYDHWFLLPGLGLCLVLADQLNTIFENGSIRAQQGAVAAWLVALIPLSALTLQQNAVWNNPIRLYERILSYEPRSAKIMNNLAMEYDQLGETQKAIDLYRRAIATQDIYYETHHNLGYLYLKQGDLSGALAEFDRALAKNPGAYMTLAYEGIVYLDQKRYDPAISFFQKSIAIHPTPQAYSGLIQAYRDTGKNGLAEEYATRAREIFSGR